MVSCPKRIPEKTFEFLSEHWEAESRFMKKLSIRNGITPLPYVVGEKIYDFDRKAPLALAQAR